MCGGGGLSATKESLGQIAFRFGQHCIPFQAFQGQKRVVRYSRVEKNTLKALEEIRLFHRHFSLVCAEYTHREACTGMGRDWLLTVGSSYLLVPIIYPPFADIGRQSY